LPFQAQGEISPGKNALLHCTTAGSTPLPLDHESFAVIGPLALVSTAFYPVLVHRPAASLHASFPHSVALMQLRFASLVVINSRWDLHPQECAHAGRTKKKKPPSGGFWSVSLNLSISSNPQGVARTRLASIGHKANSEEAFAELVRRHVNLVYSAALRQVRSSQLAEEISQSVFTDLARASEKLSPNTILTAWLYQVTRRTAIDVVRRESRRQAREASGMSQSTFAERIGTPVATLRDWEQGRFAPSGAVLCLLRLMIKHPELTAELAA